MMTMKQAFALAYKTRWQGGRSEATQLCLGKELVMLLGEDTDVADVTTADVASKVVDPLFERGNATGSVRRKLNVLTSMLNLAAERGHLEVVPKMPKVPFRVNSKGRMEGRVDEWLTREQAASFLSHFERKADWRLALILLQTGARLSEILHLRWEDVDFGRSEIRLCRTKTGLQRVVPMLDATHRELALIYPGVGVPGGPFTDEEGRVEPWWKSSWRRYFDRARVKAGLPEWLTPHVLRHTYATWLVQADTALLTVARLLGHTSIKTTMRYAHHESADLHRRVKIINRYHEEAYSGVRREDNPVTHAEPTAQETSRP